MSTLVSTTPLDVFHETLGHFPAVLVATKSGIWRENLIFSEPSASGISAYHWSWRG